MWAGKNGQNLTRHPNDNDFYYHQEVSMMWVCYLTAYAQGRADESASVMDILEESIEARELPLETEALLERAVDFDE